MKITISSSSIDCYADTIEITNEHDHNYYNNFLKITIGDCSILAKRKDIMAALSAFDEEV